MSTAGPLRQPIPVAQAILWSPAEAKRPGHIPFPLFLSQAALTAIQAHLAAPRGAGQGILGFLLGDQCECPDSHVSYLIADVALRLSQPIYGDRTRDVVTRLWDHIQAQLEQQRASLIGWYHTHPPLPLSLTAHDLETHEHYFGEPWQVALVLGTEPAEPTGALFRASADEAWVSTPLPFYELLNAESIRPDGKKRSYVTWKNYRAFSGGATTPPPAPAPARVPAAPPPARSEPAPRPPAEPTFVPTPAAPAPAPPPPHRPPRPPEPARPAADTGELRFLTAAEDEAPPAAPPPPPPPPPSRAPVVERAPSSGPRAAPPPRPHEPEPDPAVDVSAAPPVEEASWPLEFQEQPASLDAEPAEEPVVEEPSPPTRRDRRGLRRMLKLAVYILLIAVVGGGVYWWLVPRLAMVRWSEIGAAARSRVGGTWSAVATKVGAAVHAIRRAAPSVTPAPVAPRPKPAPTASPPAPLARAPARPGTAGPAPPPPQPRAPFTHLDGLGDSVALTVRLFAARARQYDARQVPCPALARGLETVESRWNAYIAARHAAGVLTGGRAARDQSLFAGVDSVERSYERSGCPRP